MLVGLEEKPFYLHKSEICAVSNVFKAACTGPWKEAEENLVRLPEDDIEAFEDFVHWLYRTSVSFGLEEDSDGDDFFRPVMAYILGDKLQATRFMNDTMTKVIKEIEGWSLGPSRDVVHYIYNHTPESSKLRLLVRDYFVWEGKAEFRAWAEDNDEQILEIPEFLRDVALGMVKRVQMVPEVRLCWASRCRYHDHGQETGSLEILSYGCVDERYPR